MAAAQKFIPKHWKKNYTDVMYLLSDLKDGAPEFQETDDLLDDVTDGDLYALSVNRVQNPHLYACCSLKQSALEANQRLQGTQKLWRAALPEELDQICEKNFDSRFLESQFYDAVVFWKDPFKAVQDIGKQDDDEGYLFLCNVLISGSKFSNGKPGYHTGCNLPHDLSGYHSFGTYMSSDGASVAKFYSDEYYPEYLVKYSISPEEDDDDNYVNNSNDDNYDEYYDDRFGSKPWEF